MEFLTLIGTVTFIHLLAVVSPGPDFVMACRNTLAYSRRTGIWTAVGFALGIVVHVFYSLAGLAFIISQSLLLFNTIKFLGAGYLVYIGLKSLLSPSSNINLGVHHEKVDITRFAAVKMGFLTNVLNPKATLFFLSLFTLVVSPETPILIMLIMGGIMILNTFLWFSLVSIFLSQKQIRSIFERFQSAFSKTFGGLLIALGIKVALTDQ